MGKDRVIIQSTDEEDVQLRSSINQFTRLANATTYTVGDLIGNNSSTAFEFASIGVANASVLIPSVQLFTDQTVSLTVLADLYLFSSAPTFTTDNSALSLNAAENRTILARIPLTIGKANAASSIITTDPEAYIPQVINIGATTSVFGLLRAENAYVPKSGEVIDIQLNWVRV